MSTHFFLIFLATILLTRIFLYFKPTPSPTIRRFRLHHYMYGIVLGIFGFVISNVPLFAIGLGLFIDEIPYLLISGKTHADNYSRKSMAGVLLFIILIFIFRGKILLLIT